MERLTNLGLWDNEIKVIHRHYFGNLSSLSYIDLDTNVINGIERSVLEEATNLQTLYFWGNLCFSGSMFNFQTNRVNFMSLLQRCFNNHQFIIGGFELFGVHNIIVSFFKKIDGQSSQSIHDI